MDRYAIILVSGKQYRVHEGDRIVVEQLAQDAGKTFHPDLLFVGGDGKAEFRPKSTTVTARVVGHVRGEKVRVGKYRAKTGYKKHTGHRSNLSEIEIESIGAKSRSKPKAETEQPEPEKGAKAETEVAVAEKPKPKPKAAPAKKTTPAKKPSTTAKKADT